MNSLRVPEERVTGVDVLRVIGDEITGLIEMYGASKGSPHVMRLRDLRKRIAELLAAADRLHQAFISGPGAEDADWLRLFAAADACRAEKGERG